MTEMFARTETFVASTPGETETTSGGTSKLDAFLAKPISEASRIPDTSRALRPEANLKNSPPCGNCGRMGFLSI
jgi:hypothetical protein